MMNISHIEDIFFVSAMTYLDQEKIITSILSILTWADRICYYFPKGFYHIDMIY